MRRSGACRLQPSRTAPSLQGPVRGRYQLARAAPKDFAGDDTASPLKDPAGSDVDPMDIARLEVEEEAVAAASAVAEQPAPATQQYGDWKETVQEGEWRKESQYGEWRDAMEVEALQPTLTPDGVAVGAAAAALASTDNLSQQSTVAGPKPSKDTASSSSKKPSSSDNGAGKASSSSSPEPEVLSPEEVEARKGEVAKLQAQLLASVASLDRGLAADARAAGRVDDLCGALEGLGGAVRLEGGQGSKLQHLAGNWRLVYSSGFNTGSLGGRRPGPPAALVPTTLGQIYQRIDSQTLKLDNVVELLIFSPFPQLPAAFFGSKEDSKDKSRESPAVRLTLRHDYEINGRSGVRIVYEDTIGELVGADLFKQLPRFELPSLPQQLKPPRYLRSATFDVTFLDESMRITRGDRGELRIYLRDE